ncbi:hypothetical protein CPB86DRAFT_757922 [Serendipita vermifera]|nr:hypothetical protein CPB86DRAFT_757922 [Serendipita vermifera]
MDNTPPDKHLLDDLQSGETTPSGGYQTPMQMAGESLSRDEESIPHLDSKSSTSPLTLISALESLPDQVTTEGKATSKDQPPNSEEVKPSLQDNADSSSNGNPSISSIMMDKFFKINAENHDNLEPQPSQPPVLDLPMVDIEISAPTDVHSPAIQPEAPYDDYSPRVAGGTVSGYRPIKDILDELPTWYRLITLINDGSDKALIHHPSIRRLANDFQSGSYVSMTEIDFKKLDNSQIRPVGIYGSRAKILDFMEELGSVDSESAQNLRTGHRTLDPGLYLITSTEPLCYILFWPEVDTWEARDISDSGKNRVTFMRYLTKLCDQIVCALTDEDVEKIVSSNQAGDANGALLNKSSQRLFGREIKRTKEKQEAVLMSPGPTFQFLYEQIRLQLSDLPVHPHLQPKLVPGQERQGILVPLLQQGSEYLQGPKTVDHSPINLRHVLTRTHPSAAAIRLAPEIDEESLKILLDNGLYDTFPKTCDHWKHHMAQNEPKEEWNILRRQRLGELQRKSLLVRTAFRAQIFGQARQFYPFLEQNTIFRGGSYYNIDYDMTAQNFWRDMLMKDQTLEFDLRQVLTPLSLEHLSSQKDSRFSILKQAWSSIMDHIQIQALSDDSRMDLHDILDRQTDAKELKSLLHLWIEKNSSKSYYVQVKRLGKSVASKMWPSGSQNTSPSKGDIDFLGSLQFDDNEPRNILIRHIQDAAALEIIRLCDDSVDAVVEMASRRVQAQDVDELQTIKNTWRRETFRQFVRALNKELEGNIRSQYLWIYQVNCLSNKQLRVTTRKQNVVQETIALDLWALQLTPTEGRVNSTHIERYFLRPLEHPVHWQFVSGDHFLLILTKENETILRLHNLQRSFITYDDISIKRAEFTFCYAFDEGKKRFAILKIEDSKPSLIVWELVGKGFASSAEKALQGLPFDSGAEVVSFTHIRFIPRKNMIVMIDAYQRMVLYSLSTGQFRASVIQLRDPPTFVDCAPDGSCVILASINAENQSYTRAFHVASFGRHPAGLLLDTDGLELSSLALGKMAGLCDLGFISLHDGLIHTRFLKITSMENEYSIQQTYTPAKFQQIADHGLLHCFHEVWTRFPIIAPFERSRVGSNRENGAVHLVATSHFKELVAEMEKKIRTLVQTSNKPAVQKLSTISISSSRSLDAHMRASGFRLGDWLVGLFCLIPIHVAIVGADHFIPMKDGYRSKEFEDRLLGVELETVATHLSLGWYESIFNSYLADMPVRVITSMGEQSMGKSYALNHLAGTSFAGSAMRCTEGAWLSVTPCDNELVVTIDFEGINSVERSKQEDMLLLLFQTALSNLILLRTQTSMSRALTKILTSFHNTTKALDPKANPDLFNSSLVFVVRDVPEEDTEGIVQEFDEKLGKIVMEEGDDNFLSLIHHGTYAIIPWPVMSSSSFYQTFDDVRSLLLDRPISYRTGGHFLNLLKMVMAKIQAKDWSPLEHNMAKQRAQWVDDNLESALALGKMKSDRGPLFLHDTRKEIRMEPTDDNGCDLLGLFTGDWDDQGAIGTLERIYSQWEGYSKRHIVDEQDFVTDLSTYLQQLIESRLDLVDRWMSENTLPFGNNVTIQELRVKFKGYAQKMRSRVVLCQIPCAQCGRRCIKTQRHTGIHDCRTDHTCNFLCSFEEDHEILHPKCAIPALHAGKHVCQEVDHLCGEECAFIGRGNCLARCARPIGHLEEEHHCLVQRHTCGEQCTLAASGLQENGIYLCQDKCDIDCTTWHERHCCESRKQCPFRCLLCRRLCGVRDHFHGLEESAVHLCGDEHDCPYMCEKPGICHVEPQPQRIEARYKGRFEEFNYTLFTQEARRKRCSVKVKPGETSHDGEHDHGDDFHFCEARCPHCGYYCKHPRGHIQAEHYTEHGSMRSTEWMIENRASIRVNGLQYATGDSGSNMLCSMVCSALGRHAHIDVCSSQCRATAGDGEIEHIQSSIGPTVDGASSPTEYDWVTHRLFWERSGFKDPYSMEEREEFSKCRFYCPGKEHNSNDPSYCVLPLFHPPADRSDIRPGCYLSKDGHIYECEDPTSSSCNIIFVIDRSTSMAGRDHLPPTRFPGTSLVARSHNNRYGSTLVAIYRFIAALEAIRSSQGNTSEDSFSCVLFNSEITIPFVDDQASTKDQLLAMLMRHYPSGLTDFRTALSKVKEILETNWSDERYPVVIFLSDGEDNDFSSDGEIVTEICETAVALGKPLALYTVAFGRHIGLLEDMAKVARRIYRAAEPDARRIPCTFTSALDTVQLLDIFQHIAESFSLTRAGLI